MSSRLPPSAKHDIEVEGASAAEIQETLALENEIEAKQRELAAKTAASYKDEPARFVLECFKWKDGRKPTDYQLANLMRLVKHKRVAVRGPHGLGKTAENAWVVLWFALTRDAAGIDWKVITTASAWRQLSHFLWPEIRKWSKQLDWAKLGRDPFTKDELMKLNLRLEHGEAFAVACEDPATIEGAHADQILYIYDEAKTIPPGTFDASEGAFSGAGSDTEMEAFAFASSTPGEPHGRFYEIHARKPGLTNWFPVHVTVEDAKAAGRVSEEWVHEMGLMWGKTSAVFINRVLGNFAASEEDGVIPLSWIEAAVERWHKLEDADWPELGDLEFVGVDVARSGGDKTVLALRYGNVLKALREYAKQETMATAGYVHAELNKEQKTGRKAIVDVLNAGAGVVDRLNELGDDVLAFNASEKSDLMDRSDTLGMLNLRAAAWWNLREMLDPERGDGLALPPHDLMIGDLMAPKWKPTSGGKIQVESKEDIVKRIGRSTDHGDAVVMAFFTAMTPQLSAPTFFTKSSRWAPTGQRNG